MITRQRVDGLVSGVMEIVFAKHFRRCVVGTGIIDPVVKNNQIKMDTAKGRILIRLSREVWATLARLKTRILR